MIFKKESDCFMIIGLCGPFGSGCTTLGKFLAGLQDPRNKNLLEMIGNEINNQDTDEDKNTKEKRLYNSVLAKTQSDDALELRNLNDLDKKLFGCEPFIYISCSFIIFKIVCEAYADNFYHYYDFKDKKSRENCNGGRQKYIDVFEKLEDKLKDIKGKFFNISGDQANNSRQTIKKMERRYFPYTLEYIDIGEKNEYKNQIKLEMKTYYDYLESMRESFTELEEEIKEASNLSYDSFIELLQDFGDNIRKKGNPFRAEGDFSKEDLINLNIIPSQINILIKIIRYRLRFLDENFMFKDKNNVDHYVPTRFVVDCFRNPYEVDFFRSRYNAFYLVSVTAAKEERFDRLKQYMDGNSAEEKRETFEERDKRSQGDIAETNELYKLNVRSCVLISDIMMENTDHSRDDFKQSFLRYLALMIEPGCVPPKKDELFMHLAYSYSLQSMCLSRKVGAIVVLNDDKIVGAGWNKAQNGSECGFLLPEGFRDEIKNHYEANNLIIPFDELWGEEVNGDICCQKEVYSVWKRKFVDIEVHNSCRSDGSHAEQNAIADISTEANRQDQNLILYTTTYPCEACTAKIEENGNIQEIIYTEPYPTNGASGSFTKKQFGGVTSYGYFKLFKNIIDKKDFIKIERMQSD
jgi:dCMP deaminase